MSVVIVESNRQMQHLLRAMLASFNVRKVRIFGDCEGAVASMLSDIPNVFLLDWDAPPYGGKNLLKLIRHQKMFPLCLVPIVVTFAHAKQKNVESAMRLGAQAAIVKPIAPENLMLHIDYVRHTQSSLKLVGERYVVDGMAEQLDEESAKRKQLASAREYQMEQLEALNDLQNNVDRILGSSF